jgi:hypothetical protein
VALTAGPLSSSHGRRPTGPPRMALGRSCLCWWVARASRFRASGDGAPCGLFAQLEWGTRRMIGSSRSVACW